MLRSRPEHLTELTCSRLVASQSSRYSSTMDILTTPCKFTAVLLLLKVTTLISVQCYDLHHLKKGGCQISSKLQLPATLKVSLNMTGSDLPLQSGDINKRSTSPWTYSPERNANRYPLVIMEAKCDMTSCVDAKGEVDNYLSSVPIRQEILVLHREIKGCTPTFRLEKKIVTVGCTCVRAIVQEQV